MIEVINVSKSFGNQQVLKGLSLTINSHETVAVVGPSGVGKSVLLKLITGLLKPDSGKILIKGKDICKADSEYDKNLIRKDLGMLFQSAALLDSLSVFDNIAFPLIERGKRLREDVSKKVLDLMKSLSLTKYAKFLPQEISIGMRKRVGIARALITEPDIFLLDEPNTGLDPIDGQEVYELIKECKKKWNFAGLVISHEIPEVFQVSDRVAMLLDGKIAALGSPEELLENKDQAVIQFLEGKIDGPIKIK